MKVRQGFVSNSSSSSFIVAFPKGMQPEVGAVHTYLFGADPTTVVAFGDGVPSMDAAAAIARMMGNQVPNDVKEIAEAMDDHMDDAPRYDDYVSWHEKDDDVRRGQWEAYENASREYREKYIKELTERWGIGTEVDVYTFEFSDNDGNFWATLEHGDTFSNVHHVRVSNH